MKREQLRGRSRRVLAVATGLVFVVGGTAYATTTIVSSSRGSIVACVKRSDGSLRIVSSASKCRKAEYALTWQGGTDAPRTVTVNCAAGQRINRVLADNATGRGLLTIEIKGTCKEEVHVTRDNVTLRAASFGAGIRAPATSDWALTMRDCRNVLLQQLTLTGGRVFTLQAFAGASFQAFDLHVEPSAGGAGMNVEGIGDLENALVPSMIDVWGGSLHLSGGTIGGVTVTDGGLVRISGTHVTGGGLASQYPTVQAMTGGSIESSDVTVENGTHTGVLAWEGGSIRMWGDTLVQNNAGGGIGAEGGSVVLSGGTVRDNTGGGVFARNGGILRIDSPTVVEANAGDGVALSLGSSASIGRGVVIRRNTGSGVSLADSSVAGLDAATQVTDNGSWGVFCSGPPADPLLIGATPELSGNGAGTTNCNRA